MVLGVWFTVHALLFISVAGSENGGEIDLVPKMAETC